MKAKDIMTTSVVTVTPETQLHAILALLLQHRISGVPVVDSGKVIGAVGGGDLLHRHEIGTERRADDATWWQRFIQTGGASAYVQSHGAFAKDLMNPSVISITEDTSLNKIALIFEQRHIRRIVVLRNSQLIGLVTRSDVLRVLATCAQDTPAQSELPNDESIRLALLAKLSKQPWWSGHCSNVYVERGIVQYVGIVESEADRQAARIAAEHIPGVRSIDDQRIQAIGYQLTY
jgi:CBS domain-containing protein